jgi:hypothetical protein
VTAFIDPEEFPFTRDEIHVAARFFLPEETAAMLADHLAHLGPTLIAAREERRAEWRRAGVSDADRQPLHAWGYPDDLLPALASLSPHAESRARRLMEDQWAGLLRAELQSAQRAAAERAGIIPTREELLARVHREVPADDPWLAQGLVVGLPPLPAPTADMITAAEAKVAERRRAWETRVEHFRAR